MRFYLHLHLEAPRARGWSLKNYITDEGEAASKGRTRSRVRPWRQQGGAHRALLAAGEPLWVGHPWPQQPAPTPAPALRQRLACLRPQAGGGTRALGEGHTASPVEGSAQGGWRSGAQVLMLILSATGGCAASAPGNELMRKLTSSNPLARGKGVDMAASSLRLTHTCTHVHLPSHTPRPTPTSTP